MLIQNYKESILALIDRGVNLADSAGDQEARQKLSRTYQETREKQSPIIMFYGLYNAGKSTLINALCKREVAKVGDVPTTASVQVVPWNGYTLIDTPGINANYEHTKTAQEAIDNSDLILFVVDNTEGHENENVYRVISEIIRRGKAIAVVINQKYIQTDGEEDLDVPDMPSMKNIVGKISLNLENYGNSKGIRIRDAGNFLGIFPINALSAFDASQLPEKDSELLYRSSGIMSLVNAMDSKMRSAVNRYMLQTPLLTLRDTLAELIKASESSPLYAQKEEHIADRAKLIESKQRLGDTLLQKGLLRIDACFEDVRRAGANGKPYEEYINRLNSELMDILKEAAARESQRLDGELKLGKSPELLSVDEEGSVADDELTKNIGKIIEDGAAVLPLIIDGPAGPVIVVIKLAVALLKRLMDKDKEREQARQDAERLAAYYKWLNELQNYEASIRTSYSDSVQKFLAQVYDERLAQLDRDIAGTNAACKEHMENVRAMEALRSETSEMLAKLGCTE